jgi:sialic acid synthase SpsE
MIILDFGSGNTCKNNYKIIAEMIDELAKVDTERVSIIKWQLFLSAGDNIPLKQGSFDFAYSYAQTYGFKTTSSVFDQTSLDFLLNYKVPFIKIANKPTLYKELIPKIPNHISVVASWNKRNLMEYMNVKPLCCISKYPAKFEDYEDEFNPEDLIKGISDHTTDFRLYKKYRPEVYEVHFKLYTNTGLDTGPFAKTPAQLKEILNEQ